jgi:hypothetical protein
VVDAQQKIVEACKRHGVAAGYQFVTLASDSRFMAAKAADEVAAVRKTGVKAGRVPTY